jgi:hypothetical protein
MTVSRLSRPLWAAALSLLSVAGATACSSAGAADTLDDDVVTGAGQALVDEPAEAATDEGEDEDILFLRQNGFETFHFALDCRSVGEDGSVIGGDPLPVGNGRSLQCETETLGSLSTVDALSSTGERFCALGQMDSFFGDGSPDLTVSIASSPEGAPWSLVGTHDGDEIEVGKVAGPGGASAWPLWVDAHYAVIDVQPNPTAQLCDQLFGL